MNLILRCGGILRTGPERVLIDNYLKRANALAQSCGFMHVTEQQIDLRKLKNRENETRKLIETSTPRSRSVILDEGGKSYTSRQTARRLELAREDGYQDMIFLIGGADGFNKQVLKDGLAGDYESWSFGKQTWPHKLVRVMLAEQIYRSLSILAKTPYHRD